MRIVVMLLACAVAPAMGYWTQYRPRPNAPWPEDQGWERITWYGGAERKIEDGALVLDSTGHNAIVDYYVMYAPGMIHAEPEHPFALQWGVRVDYSNSAVAVGVGLFSDDRWGLGFNVALDRIYDIYAYPKSATFEPGWHVFRMTTTDMRSYVLAIDGVDAMSGLFEYDSGFTPSNVGWGDTIEGGLSVSRWSFAGFGTVPKPSAMQGLGIVPEPTAMFGVLSMPALVLRALRRGRAGL